MGRRHGKRATAGALLVAALGLGLAACGGNSGSKAIDLSVSSGTVGTVVHVSGSAGSGCVLDKNWFGFKFGRFGQLAKGPVTQLAAPIVKNGTWSATFAIPSYLGPSSASGKTGAAVTPGRYELMAPSCQSKKPATASFKLTSATPAAKGSEYIGIAATVDGQGYWLAQANGTVHAFGDAKFYGSLPAGKASASRIVGIARTYSGHGYWLVAADGHIFTFGDAHDYGSAPDNPATEGPVTGMAVSPDGKGYWVLTTSGHVFGFGDAKPMGDPTPADAPYDAIGTRPAGGYIVTAANNGATFLYPGGLVALGGGPGTQLSATLVGTAVTPNGNAAWQTGLDGGVVTTYQSAANQAPFFGSIPGESEQLKAPITAIAGSPDGQGYWLLGATGSVYVFGSAHFFGPGKS